MKSLILMIFALVSSGALQANAANSELKLLNYNVGLLRMPGKGDMVDEVDLRGSAIPGAIKNFVNANHPDFILLEEAWEEGHQKSIKATLESLGYQVSLPKGEKGSFAPFTRESMISLVDVGYQGSTGLVVAWNKSTVEATSELTVDSYGPRHLLAYYEAGTAKALVYGHFNMISTKTPIFFLGAYSTAMDVNPGDGTIQDNDGARDLEKFNAGQIQLVLDTVHQKARANEIKIVMGDFNTGIGLADENFHLLENGLGTPSLQPASATWDRSNRLVKEGAYPNDPSSVIDHIFVRGSTQSSFEAKSSSLAFVDDKVTKQIFIRYTKTRAEKFPLSDHYGVYVTGELSTTGK